MDLGHINILRPYAGHCIRLFGCPDRRNELREILFFMNVECIGSHAETSYIYGLVRVFFR